MVQWRAETCCWEIWLKIHFNNYLTEVVFDYILHSYIISIWTWTPTIITQSTCAFAKLQNATIRFVSVCPSAWNNLTPTERIFMEFYMSFRKYAQKLQVPSKPDSNNGYFTRRHLNLSQYQVELFLERDIFRKKVVKKMKTHNYGQ